MRTFVRERFETRAPSRPSFFIKIRGRDGIHEIVGGGGELW